MEEEKVQHTPQEQEEQDSTASLSPGKQPWQDPQLTFVEPKLTTHGKLEAVTAGFFGGFTP